MSMRRNGSAAIAAAALVLGLTACGGGMELKSSKSGNGTVDVVVSAGGPVSGATVNVYAIDDATGQVNTQAGSLGIIGAGGPTDAAGKATLKFALTSFTGPVQVVASGASLSYPDPTAGSAPGKDPPRIQIPSTFVLSSYVARYEVGTPALVPVTLLTTLADHEALAVVRGLHPKYPVAKSLTQALSERDPLWVSHFTGSANAWDPAKLRWTVPASFTSGSTTLVDTAYAGLFDVALNQLAHDVAVKAGYGAGSSAMTAITLAQLLEQDLDADGVLNGKGGAAAPIVTQGTTPVTLDGQFLRKPLAQALDTWVQNIGANLSSVHQADLIAAQVFSRMSTDESDLFGDPPAGAYDPVDRAPPEVALVAEPASYLAAAQVTLTMTAKDPSGVAGVFVRVGATRYVAEQQPDGTYQTVVQLPVAGHNVMAIWAVDGSPAANSGLDGQPPYQLTRDLLFDTTVPTPGYDATFASYYDERGITVGAQVPPAYSVGPKTAVAKGGAFFKVATRLAAGQQATAAELETTNVQNIPLLRFAVPYNPQTDSPITQATYTVSTTCPSPCSALPDARGALLASPNTTPETLYFTLPLSTEYVPALASVQGAATLSVTVTVVDAAGNRNVSEIGSFTFHVLGPPLVVTEDTSYAAANDGKSTFPYRIAQNGYAALYDPGNGTFNPENNVRLVHYTIRNPSPQAVGLGVLLPGATWQGNETWSGASTPAGSRYYASRVCEHILGVGSPYMPDIAPAGYCTGPGNVLVSGCAGSGKFFAPADGSPHQCEADPGAPDISGTLMSAGLLASAYYSSGDAAALTGAGHYLVPGASGSSPGVLSLYIVRPRAGVARPIALGWDGARYVQDIGYEATRETCFGTATTGPCGYDWYHFACGGSGSTQQVCRDTMVHYTRALTAASDNLVGTLQLQSLGVNGGGAEIGEAQTIPGGSIDLTRTITH